MKLKYLITILLFLFCITTSFQCEEKCEPSDLKLDSSKEWFPLKGKTQLSFLDESNILNNFQINVRDTVETSIASPCGATRIYESINIVLYPDTSNNNVVIIFRLNPPNLLIASGYSTVLPLFSNKDVFRSANEGKVAKRLNNYLVGNRSYPEVILLLENPKTLSPFDSIILAKNVGIVGFNHFAKKYTLQ